MEHFYKSASKLVVVFFILFFACILPVFCTDDATGRIMGKVLSSDGEMMIAGIIIVDEEGNSWRETTNDYGGYVLRLAPGTYTLTYDKGSEFSQYTKEITVESYKTYYQKDVRLTQLFDSYSLGWIAGDIHQHSIYSDGLDELDDLITANASCGLYWGFLTDHDTSRGVPEWRGSTGNVIVFTESDGTKRTFSGFAGDEVTSTFGHFQSIGTGMVFDRYEINLTEAELTSKDKNSIRRDKGIYIARQIKAAGGIPQINHPYSVTNMGALNFISEDDWEYFSYFDTFEIWNGYFICPDGRFTNKGSENQNYTAKLTWYSILNNVRNGGKFLAATGGTDDHDSSGYASAKNRASFGRAPQTVGEYYLLCRYEGKYAGVPTTYVFLGEESIDQQNVMDATKAGRSFISNGPVVICTVGDSVYGDEIEAIDGKVVVSCNVFARDGISSIRVVKNGDVVKEIGLDMVQSFNEDIAIEGLESGDWMLFEVLGDFNDYAITNPYFVK